MSVTHDEARLILDTCVAKADEMSLKVGIAVVDEHAKLQALIVMSGARYEFLAEAAAGKAMASVVWGGQFSGALNERGSSPMFVAVNKVYGERLFYQQGAVPIKRGDVVVGAVGVGGAASQQDEDIAAAGAAIVVG